MPPVARFQAISRTEPRRSRAALVALAALCAAIALLLAARPAGAAPLRGPASQSCPSFRVLHNDRIGAAVFPAGSYTIVLESSNLTCKSGGELFARFLEDFDGTLPRPWRVSPEGSGNSAFRRGGGPGFSVELTRRSGAGAGGDSGEGGVNRDLGRLCPNPFTVNSTTVIRPLRFTKGKFLIYLPAGSRISCNRGAVLFTRFLGAGGDLPRPWKLASQTATFYKASNPTRSAFRIAPLAGARRR